MGFGDVPCGHPVLRLLLLSGLGGDVAVPWCEAPGASWGGVTRNQGGFANSWSKDGEPGRLLSTHHCPCATSPVRECPATPHTSQEAGG